MRCFITAVIFILVGFTAFGTTIEEVDKTCAVCDFTSTQIEIVSTNSFGSADLDLRPPEMERSTMIYWVEECPQCGYCASNISDLIENAAETIKLPEYISQLKNPDYSELANRFLCSAVILEKAGKEINVIYHTICAAWAEDDRSAAGKSQAIACRISAAEKIAGLQKDGKHYMSEPGGDNLLLSDLYRRADMFEEALKSAETGLKSAERELIVQILEFEIELIKKKDNGVYKVSDAIKE